MRRSAILLVDDALVLARDAGARSLWRAIWPSLGLLWVAQVAYYAECVEGVSALRPVFAALVVALWSLRAVRLGELSARSVFRVLGRDDVPLPRRTPQSCATSAAWAGLGTLVFCLPLVWLLRSDPWWALVASPLLALRGIFGARWLADATLGSAPPGMPCLVASARRLQGERVRAVMAELLLSAAGLVLMFNIGAAGTAVVALSQDVLGFDLALVRAFLAPSNVFVSLTVLGLALAATDALRACTAALLFSEELSARGAFELRAQVEAAVQSARLRHVFAIMLLCLGAAGSARAEPPRALSGFGEANDSCDQGCARARAHDDDTTQQIHGILRRHEFRRFELAGEGVRHSEPDWLRGVFVWIDRLARRRMLAPAVPDRVQVFLLPSAWAFLGAAVGITLLTLAARLNEGRRVRRRGRPSAPARASAVDEPARAEAWLARAEQLVSSEPSEAMRCAFLGMVTALVERGALSMAPHHTNATLEQALAGSPFQALFSALRRDFEASVYGQSAPPSARIAQHVHEVLHVFSLAVAR